MADRYLIQKSTGTPYIWTETLSKQPDMEPYDPEVVKRRTEAARAKLEAMKLAKVATPTTPESVSQMREDTKILADLEAEVAKQEAAIIAKEQGKDNQPTTEKEILEKNRQDRIDEDLEVRKIRLMPSKAEVQEYCLLNFGIELKQDLHLKEMKRLAVEERVKIIFAKG